MRFTLPDGRIVFSATSSFGLTGTDGTVLMDGISIQPSNGGAGLINIIGFQGTAADGLRVIYHENLFIPGDDGSILAQDYASDGSVSGAPQVLSEQFHLRPQTRPVMLTMDDGQILYAGDALFAPNDGNNWFGQVFPLSFVDQIYPYASALTTTPQGVTWATVSYSDNGAAVRLHLFDRDLNPVQTGLGVGSALYRANTGSSSGTLHAVDVAALTGGETVVAWSAERYPDDSLTDGTQIQGIFMAILGADGRTILTDTVVEADGSLESEEAPRLFALDGGGFALAFQNNQQGNSSLSNALTIRSYDAAGTQLSEAIYGRGPGDALRNVSTRDLEITPDGTVQYYNLFTSGVLAPIESGAGGGGNAGPIVGTDGGELLSGTPGDDEIDAGGGADWITPGGGSDTIDGGAGRDMVSFVDLPEAPGRGPTDYRLVIDLGAGTVTGFDGAVSTLSAVERITGSIYADYIRGDAGDNELRGLGDYDWFVATEGSDTLNGGTGQDMVSFVEWQNTAANLFGDIFSAGGRPPSGAQATGVTVDLTNPAMNTNLAAGQTLIAVERVTGSGRQDVFWGDGNSNDFRGLGDYDWFVGSTGGRERYFGGDGLDTVTYFNADAGIAASLSNGAMVNGAETGRGTAGIAALDLYFEIENLVGTGHADTLSGSSGRNQLMGLDGDDVIFGLGGIDRIAGGGGDDTIDGGAGSDFAIFAGTRDTYTLTRTGTTTVTAQGADGTDLLNDVEYFVFDDAQVSIWDLPLA